MVATSGVNANGERWFLAPSLVGFINSVDRQFPNRDHSSDGSIGDAAHAARASDHNPCWTCTGYSHGIVRAIDVDIDGNLPGRNLREEILYSAIRHPAVWYVISNGKIYSRTYDWVANDYTGPNPHEHHVHISIVRTEAAARDTSFILRKPLEAVMATLDAEDIAAIGREVYKQNSEYGKAFWTAATGTGTLIRRDIAAIRAAIDPAKFAEAIVAKLPASNPASSAEVEAAVRAVFADAGDAS